MYLLDTDVISALRRPERNPAVAAWTAKVDQRDLYLSVATVAEIERGVFKQRKVDPPFARDLQQWLNVLIDGFGQRILQIDIAIAQRWGALSAAIGHNDPDLAIAATALEHGLSVVTRNVSDFTPTGVAVFDPSSN